MSGQKIFLRSIRTFLEKNPKIYELLEPAALAANGLLHKFELKIPQIPQKAYFQLLDLYNQYQKRIYNPNGTPRILLYTPRFWNIHAVIEHTIAIALSFKGAKCLFANCEGHLPICNIQNVNQGTRMPCADCIKQQQKLFHQSGFPNYSLPHFVSQDQVRRAYQIVGSLDYKALENLSYEGISLGKLVQISTRWFLAGNNLTNDKQSLKSYRNFVISAIIVYQAAQALLKTTKPDLIFLLNGLFFEERIIHTLAESLSIPIVTYENGFMTNSFVFARNGIACYYDLSAHWSTVKNTPLSRKQNDWLDKYLTDRQAGNRAVIQYWPKREERIAEIKKKLCLDNRKKVIVAFTNIIWDSAVQGRDIGFKGMFAWLHQIIAFFSRHSEYQFIVRIHPAEIRLKGRETKEGAVQFIRAAFPDLPSNIYIVPPDSDISSYRLIELAHLILTYSSTIGLEAVLMGKPVMVAGQTHYRAKGFTLDTDTGAEYFNRLSETLKMAESEIDVDIEMARRYSFLFFRRYMIDFTSIINQESSTKINLVLDNLEDLKSKQHSELSAVVNFILESTNLSDHKALII
jgi:hypothetical protein